MFTTSLALVFLVKLFPDTNFYVPKKINYLKQINLFLKNHKNDKIGFGLKEKIVSILFYSKMHLNYWVIPKLRNIFRKVAHKKS